MTAPESSLASTLAYHQRTKHYPGRFARALGYMDWATQPDPFRRFAGAPLLRLELVPVGDQPRYEPAFVPGNVPPAPLDRRSISQLMHDALALSAWKQAGGARWSLRVNPSSGNLHPTEGYLVAGPIAGLAAGPGVHHYAPHEHALERRADLPPAAWGALAARLPRASVLVGFTSIHWRESWKYGERAFRYCHHDVGHAIGALAVAAAGLGWETRLLEGVTDADLARLLGVDQRSEAEANANASSSSSSESEHADCLIAVFPQGAPFPVEEQRAFAVDDVLRAELGQVTWLGAPNRLSAAGHGQDWPAIDEVEEATRKTAPPPAAFWEERPHRAPSLGVGDSPLGLRPIVQGRRSAVALDGRSGITRAAFWQILLKVFPGPHQIPFSTLPWRPRIDLLLFVHRVQGLEPGLYILLRDPLRQESLQRLMSAGFAWTRLPRPPEDAAGAAALPLFLLEAGDARRAAAQTSCEQAIAADGVFAAAMLADYRDALETLGPWFYRRLHWEAGVVGQQLYLEAEASGIRATGIGCFFDDFTHGTFGIRDDRAQVLYHFTMGGAVDDPRIEIAPPYQHLAAP